MARILVVDDVADIRFAYEAILCAQGHVVVSAKNGKEAADLVIKNQFDLVVTDLMMPQADGIHVASTAMGIADRPKLLGITGGGNLISAAEAVKMGEHIFDATLEKPVSPDQLLETINALLNTHHTNNTAAQ